MSHTRTLSLPIDHLQAEFLAFPLASEQAFVRVATQLHPNMADTTAGLWRDAERSFVSQFPSFSLDELVDLRDYLWFEAVTPAPAAHSTKGPIPLTRLLRTIAARALEFVGRSVRPNPLTTHNPGDGIPAARLEVSARTRWRWLSLALPPDLLASALKNPAAQINTLSPPLEQVLKDRGFAESHLHVGAALNYSQLWIAALRAISAPDFQENAFESPGASFQEGRAFARLLLLAGTVRYLLAAWLYARASGSNASFDVWLGEVVPVRLLPILGASRLAVLDRSLRDFASGRVEAGTGHFVALKQVYADLTGIRSRKIPTHIDDIGVSDAIATFFPATGGDGFPEQGFTQRALALLEQTPIDRLASRWFWQYTRVRCGLYRHITQRPMVAGLQWFIRFFDRIRPGRGSLPFSALLDAALHLEGAGSGLRSLEVRTAPSRRQGDMVALIKTMENSVRRFSSPVRHQKALSTLGFSPGPARLDAGARVPFIEPSESIEQGWVLHFTRGRGGHGRTRGLPHTYGSDVWCSPENSGGYRFGRLYQQKRLEALAFARVLLHFPWSLELLRGQDICTDELGVPTWVFRPIFEYVRQAGRLASAAIQRISSYSVPPLRTSAHAGEDFVHLMGGLRRIDEAIDHFGLEEGDRLGHATALGVQAGEWALRKSRLLSTCEDRLWDLLWEWSRYVARDLEPPPGRISWLEQELGRLSLRIFTTEQSARDLKRLEAELYSDAGLQLAGFPTVPFLPSLRTGSRLQEYLTSSRLYQRGRQLEWVSTLSDGPVLEKLQCWLREKVARRGLCIEVNPSSNLLIGNLADFAHHPLWRLRPPVPDSAYPPLDLCVGSDDPLTFATHIRQEFQLLEDALLAAGLSETLARNWLDQVRQAGLDGRFTLRRSGPPVFSAPSPFPLSLPPLL